MLTLISKYPRAFGLAIVFHIFALGVFVINVQLDQKPALAPKVDVVQATMIDETQVQAELDKLKAIEAKKRKSETDRQKKLNHEAEKARKKRLKEQKKLKELERKRKKELAKKKKLDKERKIADKKRKEADRKFKVAEAKRKKAEKAAKVAEKKRVKEVERQHVAEKKRKKAEAERKIAQEKERKAKERVQQRIDDERERERQLAEENRRLQSARSKKEGKVLNRYMAIIQKQVANSWREPATMKSTDSCVVYVRMMPTGDVLKVEAKKCTGDSIFKRSVEDAVRKAAPLSLPPNKSLFKHFREINFKFSKPKK